MKKKIAAVISAGILVLTTGCSNGAKDTQELSADGDRFTYDETTAALCFDVLEDGTVCASTIYSANQVLQYDLDGNLANSLDTELFHIYTITAHEKTLYLTGDCDYGICAYSYDLETGAQKKLAELDGAPKTAVYADDSLYLTWTARDSNACPYESNSFSYDGTALYKLDLSDNAISEQDVEFPVNIASTPGGKLLVYAADENGLYFTRGISGERKYVDLGTVSAISAVDDDYNFVFYSNSVLNTLNYSSAGGDGEYSEMVSDVLALDNGVKYCGGFTFYINITDEQKIERVRNSSVIKENSTIRMISPSYVSEAPFGCGYSIKSDQLTADEFALSVLSLDPDYDICLLSSSNEVSGNLRNKGTYYPLNDIKGIDEYLDRCLPYVREAATAENGEIWMLPIALNIDVIMYNENSCAELGLDFTDLTAEKFRDNIDKAYASDRSSGYDAHAYLIDTNFILQLLRGNTTVDTPEFRSVAEMMKEKFNYKVGEDCFRLSAGAISYSLEEMGGNPDKFLFSMRDYSADQLYYSAGKNMRVCAMPSVTQDKRNIAVCAYLCINPASKHLDSAVDYIESLISHLGESNTSILFTDALSDGTQSLSDLKAIYENASVEFNVSTEIFRSDLEKYFSDELTLDEFITESDRKLSAYLNE